MPVFVYLKVFTLPHKTQIRKSLMCRMAPVECFECCQGNWSLPESTQVMGFHYKERILFQCDQLPLCGLVGRKRMLGKITVT